MLDFQGWLTIFDDEMHLLYIQQYDMYCCSTDFEATTTPKAQSLYEKLSEKKHECQKPERKVVTQRKG